MSKDAIKQKLRIFLKGQLERWLALFARRIIRRFEPRIVGVTGSVGKTSTKEAIYTVLRGQKKARRNRGNFNTEFGFPMTIIGDYQTIGRFWFWLGVLVKGFLLAFLPRSFAQKLFGPYPEVLVLEYAADKPGDLKNLISIAKPDISVITAIGEVPVHLEFYEDLAQVLREKSRLIEALSSSGIAILGADDERVMSLRPKTRAKVLTFGFSPQADVKITAFETKTESAGRGMPKKPMGISFKIESQDTFAPIRISSTLGKSQAYSAAAAAAVGLSLGLNLVQVADAFTFFQVPHQRVRLLSGLNQSYILDDSYNASPLAMRLAIETVSDIKARRKIGVLGDMLELGEFSNKAHDEIGRLSAKVFDLLISVGSYGRRISDAALKDGMVQKNVYHFDFAHDAEVKLLEILKKGDLVLIKGSKAVELKQVANAASQGRTVE
ncbi:MAG: UDP-N-acetylmuramoyl-tripeptide--D-alanyl-D-alanine ligase [Candidatus Harrisonbacteria bacterium]|nr:UDP-N-acetylmuramoyl-tripeptide--D-alanyl-D-alanine ligase [Candidatus Harrisonbacteria bacterium]